MILVDSDNTRQQAAEIIARGGVIAFRTDTFYGLGVDPFNVSAIQRIKKLKGREGNKPILVLISDSAEMKRLVHETSPAFSRLAQRLWPGALTIIGDAAANVPGDLTAGTKTLGVRLPNDDKVRALVAACGGALTATSANRSTEPPARTAAEVEAYFGDQLDLIVDDGNAKTDLPSTVIDATGEDVQLIREGVIDWGEVLSAIGA